MLIQLPEEKKALIFPLFKKTQPNRSALGCYFNGTMTGKTFVDDLNAPTKAICQLDMSWVYISDNADLPWIEETLRKILWKYARQNDQQPDEQHFSKARRRISR